MSYWSFYFLAKLGLYAAGYIGFHWLLNLVFAAALVAPLPVAAWRRARHVLAAPVAIALLWHDSFWPPLLRVIETWPALSRFSGTYAVELLGRLISWQVIGALLLGAGLYAVLIRRVRLGVVAMFGMLVVPLLPVPGVPDAPLATTAVGAAATPSAGATPDDAIPTGAQLDTALQTFYESEAGKTVRLPDGRGEPPFDLVFLSVCSLAWDDLETAGIDEALLLRRFDVVFRQFNSAASYSGPAVLRLLRAGCGQVPQRSLYDVSTDRCYLFQRLTAAGWRSSLLLNHDGHFDGFADQLRRQGAMGPVLADNRTAPVAMRSFDNSPIYADLDLLTRWWEQNLGNRAAKDRRGRVPPTALLYNTISLHDGNHVPGLSTTDSLQTWKPRAQKLFKDFDTFFQLIERSGRPTVVVLVPEHGASLRGDAVQFRGLRENPTPRITHVPAGLALFGFGPKPAGQTTIQVQQVSSYASLLAMVSALMQTQSGGTPWSRLARTAEALPTMEWVAENGGTVMMRKGSRLYLREGETSWIGYPTGR